MAAGTHVHTAASGRPWFPAPDAPDNPHHPHLLRPLPVGGTVLPNRLMTAAISHDLWRMDPSGYNRWNLLGDRARAFYEDRARGGFGLLTVGQLMVHPSCGTNRPAAFLDTCVDEYRPIAAAIHEHGARVFAQLNHNGRGRISGTDDWAPVLTARPGPSFYPGAGGEFTKEIERSEITEIVEGFARSAVHLQRTGFDGVEVHAAHSYLLSEFLTPGMNRRTDEYGGSLENRMRFLREVLEAVRAVVDDEFVVGVRLNGEWRMADGFELDEATEVASQLAGAGLVDFVHVNAWGWDVSLGNPGTDIGPVVPMAARVREAVDVPVFVVGRILDAEQAERVVGDGAADVVAMARASIADPELPQNPTVGREAEWGLGTLAPAATARRVVAVGGGPAGLEAAVIAARRGHDVILLERDDRLGAQVNLIVRNPRRVEFGQVVDIRAQALADLGVGVRTGLEVDVDAVVALAPDLVVVATGSAPRPAAGGPVEGHWSPSGPDPAMVPGAEQVHDVADVLEGRLDGAGRVVLVDGHGYYQSSDALEYLVGRGASVVAATPMATFAPDMTYNDRPGHLETVRGRDVTFHPYTRLTAVRDGVPDAVRRPDGPGLVGGRGRRRGGVGRQRPPQRRPPRAGRAGAGRPPDRRLCHPSPGRTRPLRGSRAGTPPVTATTPQVPTVEGCTCTS